MQIAIDPNKLKLREIEFFEEYTGLSIESLSDGRISAKMATALVYIAQKRTDPAFTIEDARDIEVGEIVWADTPAAPPARPTKAATAKSAKAATS